MPLKKNHNMYLMLYIVKILRGIGAWLILTTPKKFLVKLLPGTQKNEYPN